MTLNMVLFMKPEMKNEMKQMKDVVGRFPVLSFSFLFSFRILAAAVSPSLRARVQDTLARRGEDDGFGMGRGGSRDRGFRV